MLKGEEGVLKHKLLLDSIVYILAPVMILLFTNYITIYVTVTYVALPIIFILSIYTIITKKKESRINVSGIIFSITYIMMFLLRKKAQYEFDMYIYDTYLMIILTLIIVFPTLLNKNIFKQIYVDIRRCNNDNNLRIINNINKFNLDNDFKKISLLFTSHLLSLILIRMLYIYGILKYTNNSIIEILFNIGFIMYEIYMLSRFMSKLKNNIKPQNRDSRFRKLSMDCRVIDIEEYKSMNK